MNVDELALQYQLLESAVQYNDFYPQAVSAKLQANADLWSAFIVVQDQWTLRDLRDGDGTYISTIYLTAAREDAKDDLVAMAKEIHADEVDWQPMGGTGGELLRLWWD